MAEIEKKYRMLMNDLLYLLIFLCLITGCKKKSSSSKLIGNINMDQKYNGKKMNIKSIFPDTTINGKIKLEDYLSTESFYPNYKILSFEDKVRNGIPIVIFANQSKSQYLLTYQYEGSALNAFSCFEIGYWKNESFDRLSYYITGEKVFKTESEIGLGITLEKLIAKKGNNYTLKVDTDTLILYKIDCAEDSHFLKRYAMPGYFMEFVIENNQVKRIQFGFEYP